MGNGFSPLERHRYESKKRRGWIMLGVAVLTWVIAFNLGTRGARYEALTGQTSALVMPAVVLLWVGLALVVVSVAQFRSAKKMAAAVDRRWHDTGGEPSSTSPGPRPETGLLPPEGLVVRHDPLPDAEIVKRLEGRQRVNVIERRGAWALVETGDGERWWIDGRRLL